VSKASLAFLASIAWAIVGIEGPAYASVSESGQTTCDTTCLTKPLAHAGIGNPAMSSNAVSSSGKATLAQVHCSASLIQLNQQSCEIQQSPPDGSVRVGSSVQQLVSLDWPPGPYNTLDYPPGPY
jgi:hypothetical protein